MYKEGKKKELFKKLNKKMEDQGWDNITHFTLTSKVPYSIETVRRGLSDCGHRQLGAETLAVICRYMGYDRAEIRDILKEYTDDNEIWRLIGDDKGDELTSDEWAVVEALRKLKTKNEDVYSMIGENLGFIAKTLGIQIDRELSMLKRTDAKKRR
jgi:hypothetical protein